MEKANTNDLRFIKLPAVLNVSGISRTQLYKLMGEGRFPRSVRLSARSVVWIESDIREWMVRRLVAAC